MNLAYYQHFTTYGGEGTGIGTTGTVVEFISHGYTCLLDLEYAYNGSTQLPSRATGFRLAKVVAGEL